MTERDEQFMAEAVRLSLSRSGATGDNPAVGAVLVSDKSGKARIIGRGATAAGGRPHAETQALAQAGAAAAGATLYVTLEPCCHFGKTPPCTEALIKAGIKRAVIAVADPDQRVCGQGIAALRQARIEVKLGCLAAEAAQSMAAYLCRRKFGRPFITVKLAVSADGCIGRKGEGQVEISGAPARRAAHWLRAGHDGVLIGIGTALADNPRLDCRLLGANAAEICAAQQKPLLPGAALPRGQFPAERTSALPIRLVLDTHLRLPLNSHLAQSAKAQPVWLLCGQAADKDKERALAAAGCRIFRCAESGGQIDLQQALALLWAEGLHSVLVEGGTKIIQNFWDKRLIDQLILFKSAEIIGAQGYKMPDFGQKTGYETISAQAIGADKAEIYLHLYGDKGLIGGERL